MRVGIRSDLPSTLCGQIGEQLYVKTSRLFNASVATPHFKIKNIGRRGCIVEFNVPVKLMPIVSCFKRQSIHVSIPFNRLGIAVHAIRKKL